MTASCWGSIRDCLGLHPAPLPESNIATTAYRFTGKRIGAQVVRAFNFGFVSMVMVKPLALRRDYK